MKHTLTEGSVLFVSVVKWFVLATLTGAIVGVSTTVFLKVLAWSLTLAGRYPYFFVLLPVAFLISVVVIKKLAPTPTGRAILDVRRGQRQSRSGRLLSSAAALILRECGILSKRQARGQPQTYQRC